MSSQVPSHRVVSDLESCARRGNAAMGQAILALLTPAGDLISLAHFVTAGVEIVHAHTQAASGDVR